MSGSTGFAHAIIRHRFTRFLKKNTISHYYKINWHLQNKYAFFMIFFIVNFKNLRHFHTRNTITKVMRVYAECTANYGEALFLLQRPPPGGGCSEIRERSSVFLRHFPKLFSEPVLRCGRVPHRRRSRNRKCLYRRCQGSSEFSEVFLKLHSALHDACASSRVSSA